jgi:hypothetical protein
MIVFKMLNILPLPIPGNSKGQPLSQSSLQNIPLLTHSPLKGQRTWFPTNKLAITPLSHYISFSEHDLSPQKCHSRPVQKLDAFVWRIITPIMQVSIVVQPFREKAFLLVPNHKICIRSYLYGSFLGIEPVKLGRIFGSEFHEALYVDTLAFQNTFGEE